jgi:hypothetical protein
MSTQIILLSRLLPIFHRQDTTIIPPNAVTITRNSGHGRPSKAIDRTILEEAFAAGRRISQSKLAKIIGVHRSTVRRYLKVYDIQTGFSTIGDDELDQLVDRFRKKRPNSGTVYLAGRLASKTMRVQRRRIRASQSRVDGAGVHIRRTRPIPRKVYHVKRPNALWHMDSYHKLILYGLVIHGIVDGYSRKVGCMR